MRIRNAAAQALVLAVIFQVFSATSASILAERLAPPDETPVVRAASGSFVGVNVDKVSHFLGIRYVD